MDFYGVEGVSVYSGFVSVEKYWFVYAVPAVHVYVRSCMYVSYLIEKNKYVPINTPAAMV